MKYGKILSVSFINKLAYRSDLFFSMLSKVFPFVIQVFMWTALYRGRADSVIMNYSYRDMMLYTVITLFVSALMAIDVQYTVASEIKDGLLSRFLIQPINHAACKLSEYLGSKAADFVFILTVMGLVCWGMSAMGYLALTLSVVLRFFLALALAILLQFLLFYCLASAAFWIGECGGIFTAIGVIASIVSGMVFPLDIFGAALLKAFRLLPFYYVSYFPTNVLIGRISGADYLRSLLVMLAWLGLLFIAKKFLWQRGMKKYIAAGG